MTAIAVSPIILTDVLLTLGTDSFEQALSEVVFTPTASIVTFKGLSPGAVFSFPTRATWVCQLTYAQDWETANSLSQYLHDHEGETKAAVFEPVAGGASWSADLLIVPGAIGGQIDTVPVATVQLGVNGKPELTPAA